MALLAHLSLLPLLLQIGKGSGFESSVTITVGIPFAVLSNRGKDVENEKPDQN